ncbi:MAG: type I secretion system permease/ATPase [Fimbriimonadaceae bacterium]|nr:type I secretion system permease/ATPase [Alphaproteobacteria bacterium]
MTNKKQTKTTARAPTGQPKKLAKKQNTAKVEFADIWHAGQETIKKIIEEAETVEVDMRVIDNSSIEERDALLLCLEYIAEQAGRPFSRKAVMNGLPLRGQRLTADLLPRAASRLGIKAKLVKRRIGSVPAMVGSFIVLFDNGDACVVTKTSSSTGRADVIFPLVSKQTSKILLADLDNDASGYVFYLSLEEENRLTPDKPASSRIERGHWLWSAILRFWPSWIQVILAALIINCLGLAFPLFVMNVYDRVIPNLAVPTLIALAAGVVIAVFFDLLLKQLRSLVLDRTGRRVDMKIAADMFEHALSISSRARTASSGVAANTIREFELIREFFTSSAIIAGTDLLFIGVFLGTLWLIAGPIVLIPLLAVPLTLIASLVVQAPLARSVAETQTQASIRHSILVESLVGIDTIKAVGGEGVMQRRWERAVAATARANSSSRLWSTMALHFTSSVQQIVGIIIIFWGVFLVADGLLTIGGLIAANILSGRVLAPLSGIAQTFARAQQAFAALRGLNSFMKLETDRRDTVTSGLSVKNGAVEFQDVTFAYPDSGSDALKNISFRIEPGERVGIIGKVGSGKTTIGRLLAGYYPPDKGVILVDGTDQRQYEMSELRAGIGFAAQEPELFIGSLRDNITLGNPGANEGEIAEVTRISGVDDFTSSHPLGLMRLVGERGQGLSGGQRQAVSLARILLRDPKVLYLDEPTSAMDSTTETAFTSRLEEYSRGRCTLLICTHRGSLLHAVDRLIVLDEGRLVADGPRDKILEALKNTQNTRPVPDLAKDTGS